MADEETGALNDSEALEDIEDFILDLQDAIDDFGLTPASSVGSLMDLLRKEAKKYGGT